jgi:hypothetical protein
MNDGIGTEPERREDSGSTKNRALREETQGPRVSRQDASLCLVITESSPGDSNQNAFIGQTWWYMPVIPAT